MSAPLRTLLVASAACLAWGTARGAEPTIPDLAGHITDPSGKLTEQTRDPLDGKLSSVQADTRIDLAVWIADVSSDQALGLGREAFKRWNIGRDWDNGVLLVFPRSGRVAIAQGADRPELGPDEVDKLTALDQPDGDLPGRMDRLIDAAREVLMAKTHPKPEPTAAEPEIGGHVTDPDHLLGDEVKNRFEERLGKIQEATRIDFACWISRAAEDQIEAQGASAFKRWGIGGSWDNGLLLVVPTSGRVHIFQDPSRPLLSPQAQEQLSRADDPSLSPEQRITRLADAGEKLLHTIVQPQGPVIVAQRPNHTAYYLGAAALIGLVGLALVARRRFGAPERLR